MVTAYDVYHHEHRWILRTLATLVGADKPDGVITVFEELKLLGKDQGFDDLPHLNKLLH